MKVTIPTPTVHVTDVQRMDETGKTITAKATVTGDNMLAPATPVEATFTPLERIRETVGDETEITAYRLVVTGAQGEMLEVLLGS